MEGGTLMDRILKYGRLSEEETKVIIFQLLQAVNYIHSNNIIHGDITLDNVMFEQRRP